MNGRAAAKSDLPLQCLAAEKVAERAADNQVLLDLPEIRPGRVGAPFLQVSVGNQVSISTGMLITSFHFGFFSSIELKAATIGLAAGSRSLNDFASSAKGRRMLAWRICPNRSKRYPRRRTAEFS